MKLGDASDADIIHAILGPRCCVVQADLQANGLAPRSRATSSLKTVLHREPE